MHTVPACAPTHACIGVLCVLLLYTLEDKTFSGVPAEPSTQCLKPVTSQGFKCI